MGTRLVLGESEGSYFGLYSIKWEGLFPLSSMTIQDSKCAYILVLAQFLFNHRNPAAEPLSSKINDIHIFRKSIPPFRFLVFH